MEEGEKRKQIYFDFSPPESSPSEAKIQEGRNFNRNQQLIV